MRLFFGTMVLFVCFLFSTTGIVIYRNYCAMEGDSVTLFSEKHDCCASMKMHMQMKKGEMKCCGAKSNADASLFQIQSDCCHHEASQLQLKTNVVNQDVRIQFVEIPFAPIKFKYSLPVFEEERLFLPDKTPPLLTPERLAKIQTYII